MALTWEWELKCVKPRLQTSLHQASRDGNSALIEEIIAKKFRNKKQRVFAINKLDSQKMTPLHYAAKYAKMEAATVLIDNGADPTISGFGCFF